ncbi:MAG: M10 family metallopeptidase C-terminal domain-containing protein [Rhizobium sp.]|nr:M10 family metallopeptidase C-terminal domain-containing protein [Rhizobium sp.]
MTYRTDMIAPAGPAARAAAGNVGKSGNKLADGVLSGYEWSSNSITYAFPDSKRDYGYKGERDHGFDGVNGKIQNAVRMILDKDFGPSANDAFSLEGFTLLDVSKGSDKQADLRYAESKSANPTAYAYYPADVAIGGDVWFGKDPVYEKPVVGNYAYATILHETGHALGLKHGHDAARFDRIKTTLEGKYDSLEYSVMTYHSYAGQKGGGGYTNEQHGFPQTFMMADILALQHMYGADYTANGGDTVYSWKPGSGNTLVNGAVGTDPGKNRIFATIWDGGGEDTYDLSAYSTNLSIDLRPGQSSVFKKGQLADLDQFSGNKNRIADGNIYNALLYEGNTGSLIENAIGGAGNDRLRGNSADNELTGNGGKDIFIFRTGGGSDTITDFGGGDRIDLAGMGLDFLDIQNKGADSGGNFVITFGGGDVLTLLNVDEGNLAPSHFIL